jgi:hypothetical protein
MEDGIDSRSGEALVCDLNAQPSRWDGWIGRAAPSPYVAAAAHR